MTEQYQQTDTNAGCGTIAAGSGVDTTATWQAKVASVGGTAGVAAQTAQKTAPITNTAFFGFQLSYGRRYIPSGNWTIRINVVVANTNYTVEDVYVCAVDSSGCGNAEVVGHTTGLASFLNFTGTYTYSVNRTPTIVRSADSDIYIVVAGDIGGSGSQIVRLRPDQLIDTPLDGTVNVKVGRGIGDATCSVSGHPIINGSGEGIGSAVGDIVDVDALGARAQGRGEVVAASALMAEIVAARASRQQLALARLSRGVVKS